MARLNAKNVRFDVGSGGTPDLTAQDIAAAIAFVPAGIGRELLCRVWWPEGAKLTVADLDQRLVDIQFGAWRDRMDAMVTAQIRVEVADNPFERRRANGALERAKANMWPRIDGTYALIRKAVLNELTDLRTCPDCTGRGQTKARLLTAPGVCARCNGTGKLARGKVWRAAQLKMKHQSYTSLWEVPYVAIRALQRPTRSRRDGNEQRDELVVSCLPFNYYNASAASCDPQISPAVQRGFWLLGSVWHSLLHCRCGMFCRVLLCNELSRLGVAINVVVCGLFLSSHASLPIAPAPGQPERIRKFAAAHLKHKTSHDRLKLRPQPQSDAGLRGRMVEQPERPGKGNVKGVTQAVYDDDRDQRGLPSTVGAADDRLRDGQRIYRWRYWDMVRGDALPPGADYATFDFSVNSGVARAARILQGIVGVDADGVIGPYTVDAAVRICEQVRRAFLVGRAVQATDDVPTRTADLRRFLALAGHAV